MFPITANLPDGVPPLNLTLEREGVLEQVGDTALLDEFVTQSFITGRFEWRTKSSKKFASNLITTERLEGTATMSIPVDQLEHYQDFALPPTVSIETVPKGLRLIGLNEVAELEYQYESIWDIDSFVLAGVLQEDQTLTGIGFGDVPHSRGAMLAATHQSELMLVPRGDGSALKYSGDVTQPIVFSQDDAGDYEIYQYCQVIDKQYTTSREYFSGFDALDPARIWRRNATFDGISITDSTGSWFHEYPMPVGPGSSEIRYAFTAIPYTDENELKALINSGLLDPPSCEDTDFVETLFDAIPNPAEEGDAVFFTDRSTSPGNSILSWDWDFRDGSSNSTEQNPTHRYKDNGAYQVDLTVVDASGAIGVASKIVTVTNLPPEGQIGDAFADEGEDVTITVLLADPGENDQQTLAMSVVSSASGFPAIAETRPAGVHQFIISGLAAGDYPLTLTVTDKDGGVDIDTALIKILGSGEDPPVPPPPPPPTPSCNPSVTLDGVEQAFLDLLNIYRIQAGVVPLEVSPALTKAAVRHAMDMAANSFLEHIGSDSSTPQQRAVEEEGYPSSNVSESIVSGLSTANQVLVGWKSSPLHNQNMLNPLWNAIGISREQSPISYWATSFGEVLDCPSAKSTSADSATIFFASATSGVFHQARPFTVPLQRCLTANGLART